MADFGIPCDSKSKSQILLKLYNWLLDRYRAGETAVLIVDEAQNLSDEVLEEIRLMTNLETFTEKLLQIVVVGQPELEQKLKQPNLRQLRQRLTLRAKTHPLTPEETRAYVAQRLRIAGSNGQQIFDPDALAAIHRYSAGIPRVVNLICEHCLVSAFVDHQKVIVSSVVEAVARDFDLGDYHHLDQRRNHAAHRSYGTIWRKTRSSGSTQDLGDAGRPAARIGTKRCQGEETVSRIHEALKRAEQDRAAAQNVHVAGARPGCGSERSPCFRTNCRGLSRVSGQRRASGPLRGCCVIKPIQLRDFDFHVAFRATGRRK